MRQLMSARDESMKAITQWLLIAVLMVSGGNKLSADPPLEIVTATYFGTSEDDDLQDATAAPDRTLYIVGNTGAAARNLPVKIAAKTFGPSMKDPKCAHGFVAHLDADGRKLLHYAEFAQGVALLTTVRVNNQGVYVGGYASEGLETLLQGRPGLIQQYPLRPEIKAIEEARAAGKPDKIAGRPSLGRYGAPCVLRLSPDLQTVQGG